MPPHSHDHLRRLFDQIFLAPPEQRERLLDVQCKDDSDLRKRLEAMIAAAEDDGFLGEGAEIPSALDQGLSRTYGGAARESAGDFIDRYKLLEEIGEGGMGTVWMAEQSEPVKRRVALKVIKLGMDTKQVVARFEAERQALALMDHAHIAKVLDAGTSESGRPYFVMEYIRGIPILEYCDTHKLGTVERLELFGHVCSAIQHAHQKGIIHRDIKPNNVLVTLHDGEPVPKVIDFGIAKATNSELTQKTLFTEHRQLIGTPDYMSPEQAEMSGLDIDTRSDIYSLGVLLYELLTGTTPFDTTSLMEAGLAEMMRVIREEEPHKPSTRVSSLGDTATSMAARRATDAAKLGSALRGDLDWIVMKCLEKDRTRRYETANGLLADIQRHLRDEPVVAGPPSASYRLRKYVKRNRGKVVAAGVVAVVLLLGAAGTTLGLFWALDERARVEAQAGRASEALRQVTEDFAATLRDEEGVEGEGPTMVPVAATTSGGEVEALAATAVNLVRSLDASSEAARQAEAEATARAADLEQVAEFQAEQLSGLDLYVMGLRLRESLVDAVEEDQREALAEKLSGLNFTNVALQALEENLFTQTIEAIDTQFTEQPIVRARLLHTLGNTLEDVGLLELAEATQTSALDIRRRLLGDADPDTLTSMYDLANLLKKRGRVEEAVVHASDALDGRRRVLGDEHPQTLTSIVLMGTLYTLQGQHEEAESYHEEALEGLRRVYGDEDSATLLEAIHNAGVSYVTAGRLKEAEPYILEAVAGARRVLGDDHPSTLQAISNLSSLMGRLGRFEEAEPYFLEALEGFRRVLGDEHPSTLNVVHSLTTYYLKWNKTERAERYALEVLDARRRVLGEEHYQTVDSRLNLARVRRAQGRFEEVESLCREVLEIARRVFGEDHWRTRVSMREVAIALGRLERWDEAEPVLRELLERWRRARGEEDRETLLATHDLGVALRRLGRFEEAEPYARDAFEGNRQLLGPDHKNTLYCLNALGEVLHELGQFDEAERCLREAFDERSRILGADHADTLRSMESLGNALRELGRLGDAERYLREAFEWRLRTLGADHEYTQLALGNLVRVYEAKVSAARESGDPRRLGLALEEHAELELQHGAPSVAEERSRHACESFVEAGVEESHLQRGRSLLGAAIAAQGRFADAEAILTESAQWVLDNPDDTAAEVALWRVVDLYDDWHNAEPGGGHDDSARAWREELEAWRSELGEGEGE